MARKLNYKKLLYVLLTLFLLVLTVIGGRGMFPAFADTSSYSGVLDDLRKDSSFKVSAYPDNAKDYSIKVVQVAEGENGELFLYTYQPCQKTKYLVATDINMSLSKDMITETDNTVGGNSSENTGNNTNQGTGGSVGGGFGGGGGHGRSAENQSTKLYSLKLLSCSGVFAKYLVKDFTVSKEAVRYYNITSICRVWDKDIDGSTGNNNTGNKKAYSVGNIYKVTTSSGEKQYACEPTRVVNIINPYSDFLSYLTTSSLTGRGSFLLSSFQRMGMIDAHYIAFSTDWEIDSLKSATVTYSSRSATGYYNTFLGFDCGKDITYGEEQTKYAYPTYKDKATHKGSLWTGGRDYDYNWDRIQAVSDFIVMEENLTEETQSNLQGKQWVLRFVETQRTQKETNTLGYKKYTTDYTVVDKVAVLRLEFETDGVCYNLGTVCNAVSGDSLPGNVEVKEEEKSLLEKIVDFFVSIWNKIKGFKWWQFLLLGLAVIIVIGLIVSLIKWGIKTVIKSIWRFTWGLVCLPFKAIKALFSKE